jgi:hypothetical protein
MSFRQNAKFGRKNDPQINSLLLIPPLRLGVIAGDNPVIGCGNAA